MLLRFSFCRQHYLVTTEDNYLALGQMLVEVYSEHRKPFEILISTAVYINRLQIRIIRIIPDLNICHDRYRTRQLV